MHFEWKQFQELSIDELYALLNLREKVFVVEQDCVYLDVDFKDQKAIHCLGWEGEKLAAYCRVFEKDDYMPGAISFGRVVTDPDFRGQGFGKLLVTEIDRFLSKNHFGEKIHISAQAHLEKFYESFGFRTRGEAYLEDNIPHLAMFKN